MLQVKQTPQGQPTSPYLPRTIKNYSGNEGSAKDKGSNPHLAFEKNYPKNIFITLIEHLAELGLKQTYEECVGTRESFESKNVVSLAEIHRVITQKWFQESINLTALVSNMSNKILMNSKIKKKLFHLLLIKELFSLPHLDVKEFKKQVSRKANEITISQLPNHLLFSHPSALIYLLRLLAQGLEKTNNETLVDHLESNQLPFDDDVIRQSPSSSEPEPSRARTKEPSSKEESKYYISKIICSFNQYSGDLAELMDLLQEIKFYIQDKQEELRQQYKLSKFVPEWTFFGTIVIDNCLLAKKNKQKLTFSVLNQWIQQFREMATSNRGFLALTDTFEEQDTHEFRPIILVQPPVQPLH